jgi:hypothetical protein
MPERGHHLGWVRRKDVDRFGPPSPGSLVFDDLHGRAEEMDGVLPDVHVRVTVRRLNGSDVHGRIHRQQHPVNETLVDVVKVDPRISEVGHAPL